MFVLPELELFFYAISGHEKTSVVIHRAFCAQTCCGVTGTTVRTFLSQAL